MALQTLENFEQIDSFAIYHGTDYSAEPDASKNEFIRIYHDINTISFQIQNGPIKEVGVNGCQVDTLISAAFQIVNGLNQQFPCEENNTCLTNLNAARRALTDRKRNREARMVEGTSQA